jgi:Zn-dependent M28 family amino/carboxypeptidase
VSKFINNYFLRAFSLLIFIEVYISTTVLAQSDSTRLLSTLEQLCTDRAYGRKPGTEGHRWAKAFIVDEFKAIGLQSFNDDYLQSSHAPNGLKLHNIHGMIRGKTDRYLLVTAHYDHLGETDGGLYYGCDDNASGVASMLEIARHFTVKTPDHSIIFIAFDMEESGLLGAEHWVNHSPVPVKNIDLILNMDMISKNDKNEIYASGTSHYPKFRGPVEEAALDFNGLSVKFGHDKTETNDEDWTYSSDHGPFYSKGVPHLYFGVEDHPHYHQPTDTFERTNFSFYWQVTNFLIATIDQLDKYLADE